MARSNAGTKGVPRLEREQQMLDVACEAFGTRGFGATSIADVAAAAGISKPLVYQYFGSKEGLHAACLEHAGTLLGDEIERIARGDSVGVERGMRTLEGMFTVLGDQPWLWSLLHDVTAQRSGVAADTVALHTARIDGLAQEGVAELMALAGNTDPLDVSAMKTLWLGMVDSVMDWWVAHPEQTPADMVARCGRLLTALFADARR